MKRCSVPPQRKQWMGAFGITGLVLMTLALLPSRAQAQGIIIRGFAVEPPSSDSGVKSDSSNKAPSVGNNSSKAKLRSFTEAQARRAAADSARADSTAVKLESGSGAPAAKVKEK